jgi:ABC-2 type transport system ATP-binding protein
VDNLSFTVKRGVVTGFLGPNGAGTTMRMILGLDRPTRGSVTVNGKLYRDLPAPMHEVGALLDAKAVQGGCTAFQHLKWMAQANRIDSSRIHQVLGYCRPDGRSRTNRRRPFPGNVSTTRHRCGSPRWRISR